MSLRAVLKLKKCLLKKKKNELTNKKEIIKKKINKNNKKGIKILFSTEINKKINLKKNILKSPKETCVICNLHINYIHTYI